MLTMDYAAGFGAPRGFGQFSSPTKEAVSALQTQINRFIDDPLSRVTVNGQLTTETIGQLPIAARRAIDIVGPFGAVFVASLLPAAAGQLTAEGLALDADTILAITSAFANVQIPTSVDQAVAEEVVTDLVERDNDFIKEVEPSLLTDPDVKAKAVVAATQAVAQAKAQGKSVPEQQAAGKAAAKQAITGTAKKFFDVKNPMMWVAIGGGVVGVVIIGAILKSVTAGAAASATAPAAKAVGRRSRRSLGLSPQEHAEESRGWYRSASKILSTADRISKRNRCGSIEHYTDAIAEGTVAEVQGRQAMEDDLAHQAQQLVRRATRSQRTAVRLCRR